MSETVASMSVRHTVTVALPVERAFRVFTEDFDAWWPRTHKIGQADLAEAVLEPREGGRWYERDVDGGECDWGRVLVYEPPHRLVVTWQIDGQWRYEPDAARTSEVEVRFTEEDGRTRVDLEHRHIERHGPDAERLRATFDQPGGWRGILARYAERAGS